MNSIALAAALFLFCCCLVRESLCDRRAGIYIDNGHDQTVIESFLTRREKREIKNEILNLLDIPNRPRKGFKPPLRKSAPRYLMDIYKSQLEDENRRVTRSSDLNLSGEEQQAIDESDVIITFESINHHVSGVRHERGKRLWFNVSEVPIGENIVGAELRIYQNSNYTDNTDAEAKFTVAAYQVIKSGDGERELEYITAVNTTAGFSGWLELNLTGPLATWVAFPDSNKGLYLSVHPADRPAHEVRPEDIGLVTIKGDDEMQPFMVAFLKATNHVKVRTTRDVSRVRKSDYSSIMKSTHGDSGYGVTSHQRSCQIKTLYISFKDLKWQDWIIAPDGYSAFYCAGECNFPLNKNMNATNHAIVQTLLNLIKPVQYPKPCCAPSKLTPISVLYFLDDYNVILKKYKKMVVKSCGCH